jgi:hypothetical protein
LVFDDLQDGTSYDIFITAGNDLPYEPPLLLDDSQTQHLVVSTLYNYNIDSCGALEMLKENDLELYNTLE